MNGRLFKNRLSRQWHDWQESASAVAEKTRENLERGKHLVGEWERAVEDSVKTRPMLYLGAALAAVALASLLIAGTMMRGHGPSRRMPE